MQVYKAKWNGTVVAVKVLNDNSESQRAQFVKEANMLQALRYPNVVSYMGCAISDDNEVHPPKWHGQSILHGDSGIMRYGKLPHMHQWPSSAQSKTHGMASMLHCAAGDIFEGLCFVRLC